MFAIAAVTLLAVRTAGPSQPHTPGWIVAAGPEVDVSNDSGVQSQVSIGDRSNRRSRARRRLRELGEEDTRVQLDGRWLDLEGKRGSAASRRRAPDMRVRRLDRGDRPPGPSGTTRFIVGLRCGRIGSAVGVPELFVAHRADATAPWTTPTRPVAALYPGDALRHGEADDKPWLAVDVSPTSPHSNRAYVVWTRSGGAEGIRVLLSHTDDGAHTWSAPVRVNDRPLANGAITSVAVGPDGDVYVVWDDIAARTISIARSTDGGRQFDRIRLVANERSPRSASCDPPGTSIPADPRRCVTAAATVTVDDSSGRHAGRVYVSYADASRNHGWRVLVAAFDPALRPLGDKLVDPADGATPSDQFQPAAAVDSSTGTLWACFYETNGDPRRIQAVYSCATSHDGGSSWSRPVRAASVASDEAERGANRVGYGDYQGLAVAGGLAHPIWTDSRSLATLREEIYARTLTG